MTVARAKGAKARADKWFSLIIRSKGFCESCGMSDYSQLQCAHIRSRKFNNTRCDFSNAVCLCAKCHRFYTDEPHLWGEFVKTIRSAGELARLDALRHSVAKVDWDAKADDLKALWDEIQREVA